MYRTVWYFTVPVRCRMVQVQYVGTRYRYRTVLRYRLSVRYRTVSYRTIRYRTLQYWYYGTIRYGKVRYGTVRTYRTVLYGTVSCKSSTVFFNLPLGRKIPVTQWQICRTCTVRYRTVRYGSVRFRCRTVRYRTVPSGTRIGFCVQVLLPSYLFPTQTLFGNYTVKEGPCLL